MRNCGPCQACCWFFPIAELEKPMMVNCPHGARLGSNILNRRLRESFP